MIRKILPLLILILLYPSASQAQEGPSEGAACTTAGVMARAGGPEITSPEGGRWMICNGSTWVTALSYRRDARVLLQFDYDSGACNSSKTGRIRYNSSTSSWSYCNGTGWSSFGRAGSNATCNFWGQAVGYACPDGTVFAGFLPDSSGTPIFATRCDAGQTWNGSSCTGTRLTYSWGSAGTTRNVTDLLRGDTNTATLDAISGTGVHPAAEYCAALVLHGRTDWYLPAIGEWHVMHPYFSAIGGFNVAAGVNYISSNERSAANGVIMELISAGDGSGPKGTSYNLRCIRRSP